MNRKKVFDVIYGKRKELMDLKKEIDQPRYNSHAITAIDAKVQVLTKIIEELRQLE